MLPEVRLHSIQTNQYDKATDVLWEARAKFVEIGIVLCAPVLPMLRRYSMHTKQFDKATTVLKEAQVNFIEIGDVLDTTQCLRSLGEFRSYQRDYTEASMILNETGERCLQVLGDNNRFEEKYVEAKELLTQARDESLNMGFPSGSNSANPTCQKLLQDQVDELSREMDKW